MSTINPTYKKQYVDHLGKIEGLPDMQRWRAIKNLLLDVNPKLKPLDRKFILDVKELRDDQKNDFGANDRHTLRALVEMPKYLYDALIVADPEFNRKMTSKHKGESKALWRKVAKTFPEYRIARKI